MSQLYEACKQCPRDPHLGIISSPPIHGITADNPSFTLQQPTTAAEKYIWIRLIYPIRQFYHFVRDNICLFFMTSFITLLCYDRCMAMVLFHWILMLLWIWSSSTSRSAWNMYHAIYMVMWYISILYLYHVVPCKCQQPCHCKYGPAMSL